MNAENVIVQKFGGTSMGSPASIIGGVSQIVAKTVSKGISPIVVVSAMSGVTNQLLDLAIRAVKGQADNSEILEAIRKRHYQVLEETGCKSEVVDKAQSMIAQELDGLANFLKAVAVVGELSVRAQDSILAMGEKLSAIIMTGVLLARGLKAEYVNLEALVSETLKHESDDYWDEVEIKFAERIGGIPRGTIPVVTGFFGKTPKGIVGTVGRGYSDYCASLVGSALKVSEVQIWTDVDGVLSANPKVVQDAFLIERLSFDEMAELSHFGAKVLHPYSVRPAVLAGVPIRILNTFKPDGTGTLVDGESIRMDLPFKSIASKQGITIIRITTPLMLWAYGYMAKITKVFGKHHVSIDLVSTSEVSVSLSVEDKIDPNGSFVQELSELGEISLQENQAIISIIGNELSKNGSMLRKVFDVLDRKALKVNMVSLGNALINCNLVMDQSECDRAVHALHEEFFNKGQN